MNSSHDDPLVKNRKKIPLSGWSVVPYFLVSVFVGVPLWLFVLVPLTYLWNYANSCPYCTKICGTVCSKLQCCQKKAEPEKVAAKEEPPAQAMSPRQISADRRYGLVLFGASGFTGQLAAKYIAREYGDGSRAGFRWAIAGRRMDALTKVRTELATINPGLKELPIIVADSNNFDSILAMVKQTRVVITTAGPFARYGTNLVKACALSGTAYCDITGETDWVRKMIDQYDDLARKTGARIVHFCGHDCVPWDLAVLMIAKQLKQRGEALKEVICYDEVAGSYSGGTMETMSSILESRGVYSSKLGFDPLLKTSEGKSSNSRTVAANPTRVLYDKDVSHWVGPFIMAMVMANCVRRSNAVNQYGPKVTYRESLVFPGLMAGVVANLALILFQQSLQFPPTNQLVRKYVLPKPGQGPSAKEMEESFLKITVTGVGEKGTKVRAMMYFNVDAAYKDTARMLVESGLALLLGNGRDKVPPAGGVWTPACCQGEVLLRRLEATGTSFNLSVLP